MVKRTIQLYICFAKLILIKASQFITKSSLPVNYVCAYRSHSNLYLNYLLLFIPVQSRYVCLCYYFYVSCLSKINIKNIYIRFRNTQFGFLLDTSSPNGKKHFPYNIQVSLKIMFIIAKLSRSLYYVTDNKSPLAKQTSN